MRGLAIIALLMTASALSAQIQMQAIGSGPSAQDMAIYQNAVRMEAGGNSNVAVDLMTPLLKRWPAEPRFLAVQERALTSLDRQQEMLPLIRQALQKDSTSTAILTVAVRVFGGNGLADSAARYARRWSALSPVSVQPWQQWSEAATRVGDFQAAVTALEQGREAIGSSNVLAPDLAAARQRLGDYAGATREWLKALEIGPSFRVGAVLLLGSTPPASRSQVLQVLQGDEGRASRALQGLLIAGWGDPLGGVGLIRSLLKDEPDGGGALLQDLLSQLQEAPASAAVQGARGEALEMLAGSRPGEDLLELQMEAANAYAAAGREQDARRLLTAIASNSRAPQSLSTSATEALLAALIAEGRVAEAETTLVRIRDLMGQQEYQVQRHRVALLWMQRNQPQRAEALAVGDSTVSGIDLYGRVRLWQGDLTGAAEALRYAGPFDDVKPRGVSRLAILTLLQAVGDSLSATLGKAFLALELGDSATVVELIDSLLPSTRPEGAAALQLRAAELLLGMGRQEGVEARLAVADNAEFPGTAAQARLLRARLLVRREQFDQANTMLESLILDFPASAVLPEARRLRNQIVAAVPGGGG